MTMTYGSCGKSQLKSRRAGFVDAYLEELRRRWEATTDDREKGEISRQIGQWQSLTEISCDSRGSIYTRTTGTQWQMTL